MTCSRGSVREIGIRMERPKIFIFLCVLFVCITGIHARVDEKRLIRQLMSSYYSKQRPTTHDLPDTPINVSLSLDLKAIDDYDVRRRVLTLDAWLTMEWTDVRLQWNPADYDGVDRVYFPANDVWIPDIVLLNSLEPMAPRIPPRLYVHVTSAGTVSAYIPAVFRVRCSEGSPAGVAVCRMSFMSWVYDGFTIDVYSFISEGGPVSVDSLMPNPSVELVSTNTSRVRTFYPCCPEPYPQVIFTIEVKPKTKHVSSGSFKLVSLLLLEFSLFSLSIIF